MYHGGVSPEIAHGLLALTDRITAANIRLAKLDAPINVAVWNISRFDKNRRTNAPIRYMPEILGQFDPMKLGSAFGRM